MNNEDNFLRQEILDIGDTSNGVFSPQEAYFLPNFLSLNYNGSETSIHQKHPEDYVRMRHQEFALTTFDGMPLVQRTF